jgi:hypothetical protein
MITKTIFAIAVLIGAVGTIGIIAGAPAADAQAQSRVPGQSGCNPGQNDVCPPPGQGFFVNPGQCQKDLQEFFGFSKEDAHNFCHTTT